jgi:hypothetical protein
MMQDSCFRVDTDLFFRIAGNTTGNGDSLFLNFPMFASSEWNRRNCLPEPRGLG